MKTLTKNRYVLIRKKNKFNKNWNGVPATSRRTLFQTSLYESVFVSLVWHIVGALLLWAISFTFIFFGIIPKIFPKPEPKIHDIEFIIKNQKPHYHRIKATHSTKDTDQSEAVALNKTITEVPLVNTKKQNNSQSKNNINNKATKSKAGAHATSKISDFSMPTPNLKSMSSGLGGTGRKTHHAAGFDSSTVGSLGSSSSGGSDANGTGHSGFDKNTTRKIITTYDISPYVNELKRNIRWNWKSPKDHAGKKVDLFLRIAKDGRLVILNVKRTSEIGEIDNAALNAVRKSTPLNPLPAKYPKGYLDVIFTFDSNSIGSRY